MNKPYPSIQVVKSDRFEHWKIFHNEFYNLDVTSNAYLTYRKEEQFERRRTSGDFNQTEDKLNGNMSWNLWRNCWNQWQVPWRGKWEILWRICCKCSWLLTNGFEFLQHMTSLTSSRHHCRQQLINFLGTGLNTRNLLGYHLINCLWSHAVCPLSWTRAVERHCDNGADHHQNGAA